MTAPPPLAPLRARFGPGASWPDAAAARRHGLAPLWGAWHAHGDTDPALSACAEDHRRATAREVILRTALGEILDACAASGAPPPRILKGMARVLRDLPRPGLRPMLDIDLLPEPGALVRTARALSRAGFEPVPHGQMHWRRGGDAPIDVDLHEPDRMLPVPLRLEDPAPLGEAGGRAAWGLAPAEDFLWTCVHALALHAWPRGMWLLDLALLRTHAARRGEEDRLWNRLREAGYGSLAAAARSLLDARPLPRPRGAAGRRLREAWKTGGGGDGSLLALLAWQGPAAGRARHIVRVAFPPARFLARRYPGLPPAAARAVRLAGLASRAVRAWTRAP